MNIGLRWLPLFYSVTIMLNVFSIIHSAPPSLYTYLSDDYFHSVGFLSVLYFHLIPLWGNLLITAIVGITVGTFVMFFVKPRLKKSIEGRK